MYFKKLFLILIAFSLLFTVVSQIVTATFSNPSPPDDEDAVFTSIWDYGVNVTLSITWTGSGTQDINFYWSNGTLIGTDTDVSSGDTASILVHNLSFATTYQWYAKTGDGSEQSSTYTFTTSDVFVVQKNNPNSTPYAWVKSSENPTIPLGSAGEWDSTDIEGTTAFYDNVTDRFVIIYSGGSTMDNTTRVGVCYAYNISDLQNPYNGSYDKDSFNPVIVSSGNLFGLGVLDDREGTGEVKLYGVPQGSNTCHLWINTDGNWSNWTHYGGVLSNVYGCADVIKLNGTYIMMTQPVGSDDLVLYYSNDGKTSWTADSNNPVILESWWYTDQHCSTPQLFWINTTNSSRVYCSLEVGDGSGNYMGAIAWCNYSDLIDGDNASTWHQGNNGNEYAVGDDVNGQDWECSNTAEHKTVYFPRKDPYHLYLFYESQCSDHTQVGTAYTTVYGVLDESSDDGDDISFNYINGQMNNTISYSVISSFNWTKVANTTYYQLQVANDSAFTDVFLNLSVNATNFPGNYTEGDDYVLFTLPEEYRKTWDGDYYFRVRSVRWYDGS